MPFRHDLAGVRLCLLLIVGLQVYHIFLPAPLCPADLHTIGGLPTLLGLLGSPHPSLRWRAAEVAATCVQNNPSVQVRRAQQLCMELVAALCWTRRCLLHC